MSTEHLAPPQSANDGSPRRSTIHRWKGKWIWAQRPDQESVIDSKALLRRRFVVEKVPDTAPLRIAGDSRYVVWVNGVEVVRGPIRGIPNRLHYDEVDIAAHLQSGDNTVAILARYYGVANPWWRPAARTLSLGDGSVVAEIDLPDGTLITDASWHAQDGSAWTPAPPTWRPFGGADGTRTRPFFEEILDARLLAADWRLNDFDDTVWPAAEEITAIYPGGSNDARPPSDPYGPLQPRPIPHLGGEMQSPRKVSTATVPAADLGDSPVDHVRSQTERLDGSLVEQEAGLPLRLEAGASIVVFDFGGIVSGTLRLEIEAASGTVIDLAFAEEANPDGVPYVRQLGGIRYVARGEADAFEAIEPCGGRFVVAVIHAEQPAVIVDCGVRRRSRPRTGDAFFACSDPLLNQIYEIGVHTIDLLAQDVYISDLAREQRAWMDYAMHQMVDFVANDDWSLARWHPQVAASPRPDGMLPVAVGGDLEHENLSVIPDHALHWIRTVHNLYRYTGDRELVASLLPVAEGVLRWFIPYVGADGLLHEVEGHPFIDWASIYMRGCSSSLNALWARSLHEFEEMSVWVGDAGRARWASDVRRAVATGLEWFWDTDRGGYVDHAVDGQLRRPLSVHATAAAVCAGVLPAAHAEAALELLTDPDRRLKRSFMFDSSTPAGVRDILLFGPPEPDWDVESRVIDAGPFFRYVIHEAVARLGHPEMVADLCREWGQFVEAGETTWPETWHGGTHCHGWSSTPTPDLVVYTAGISPALPGFERVRVAPALGDLDWVETRTPTPSGPVSVRAERGTVTVEAPVEIEFVDTGSGRTQRLAAGRHSLDTTSD